MEGAGKGGENKRRLKEKTRKESMRSLEEKKDPLKIPPGGRVVRGAERGRLDSGGEKTRWGLVRRGEKRKGTQEKPGFVKKSNDNRRSGQAEKTFGRLLVCSQESLQVERTEKGGGGEGKRAQPFWIP